MNAYAERQTARINALAPIEIDPQLWEQTGPDHDPTLRLLGPTLRINGTSLHLEAYAVEEPECPTLGQRLCPDVEGFLDAEWEALIRLEPDSAMQTTEINGRLYLLVARPFGV